MWLSPEPAAEFGMVSLEPEPNGVARTHAEFGMVSPNPCPRNEESCIRTADARSGLHTGRCRPCGYNLVELSRFAVGIHPLVFESLAWAYRAVMAVASSSSAGVRGA